jgi:hypothetical protein
MLTADAYASLHVLDCFLSFFVDMSAEQGASADEGWEEAVLYVSGRDGRRPGGKLSGQALVGRRIAVRSSDDKKMRPATVTGYDPRQWLKHYILSGDRALIKP